MEFMAAFDERACEKHLPSALVKLVPDLAQEVIIRAILFVDIPKTLNDFASFAQPSFISVLNE